MLFCKRRENLGSPGTGWTNIGNLGDVGLCLAYVGRMLGYLGAMRADAGDIWNLQNIFISLSLVSAPLLGYVAPMLGLC